MRIVLTVLQLAFWFAAGSAAADPLFTYPLKIDGHTIRAEIANTEADRRAGLMFRRQLPQNQGMLFVYAAEGHYAMWMKNTQVALSVAFIDKHGIILNIEDMQPETEDSHGSKGAAKYSLEMNRGWFQKRGIKSGAKVQGLERIPNGT